MLQDVEEITLMDGCQEMKYISPSTRGVNKAIPFNHLCDIITTQNYNYSSYGDSELITEFKKIHDGENNSQVD
jgi:hypothetical protein